MPSRSTTRCSRCPRQGRLRDPQPYDGVLLEILGRGRRCGGHAARRIGEPGATAAPAPAAVAPAAGSAARPPRATGLVRSTAQGGCSRRGAKALRRRASCRRDPARVRVAGSGARTWSARWRADGQAPAPAPVAAPAATRRRGPGRAAAARSPRPRRRGPPTDANSRPAVEDAARRGRGDEGVADDRGVGLDSVEVDFDNVERVRRKHKDRFQAETGSSLSLPAVHLPRRGRRAARVPDRHILDSTSTRRTMTLHPTSTSGSRSTWTSRPRRPGSQGRRRD